MPEKKRYISGLWEKAPAKLNFCLRILDKRPDGFHNLESLMVPVDLFDTVGLLQNDQRGIRVICPGYRDLENKANLVVRTAKWYADFARIPENRMNFAIHIDKKIPVAAGLGGGSADAAATLRLLQQTFDSPVSDEILCRESVAIGSDVPFCFAGRACWVEGRGEHLGSPVRLPAFWILLANPGIGLRTERIFKIAAQRLTKHINGGRKKSRFFEGMKGTNPFFNDLMDVAFEEYPELKEKVRILRKSTVRVSMTGSGPTLFALFDRREAAESLEMEVRESWEGWSAWVVRQYHCGG